MSFVYNSLIITKKLQTAYYKVNCTRNLKAYKKIDRHKRIAVLSVTMFGNSTDVTMGLEVLHKK